MINNRQGGRRRGRGGQRPQGMSGNSGGNARDNRQRGNAAQLLEKYKSMARDAQLAGDRVQTEYYLQFADHYFRVLEEGRARFEEQNPGARRRREEEEDEDADFDTNDNGGDDDGDDEQEQEREREPRREPRQQPRAERQPRENQQRDGQSRDTQPRDSQPRDRPRERPRPNGRTRDDQDNGADERIAMSVLPPAIGTDASGDEDEAPRPVRRTRRPRAAAPNGDETDAA